MVFLAIESYLKDSLNSTKTVKLSSHLSFETPLELSTLFLSVFILVCYVLSCAKAQRKKRQNVKMKNSFFSIE